MLSSTAPSHRGKDLQITVVDIPPEHKHSHDYHCAGTWASAYNSQVSMLLAIFRDSEAAVSVTLLLIGEKDATATGKQWWPPDVQEKLGHYKC